MSVFEWGDRIAWIEKWIDKHRDPVESNWWHGVAWTSYADGPRGQWYRDVDERHAKLAKEVAELRGLLACHKIKDRRSGASSRRSPDRRAS